jgi:hypothetical protein
MIDIVREIDAVQREVGHGRIPAGEGRMIRLHRTYDAAIDDVWDALTSRSGSAGGSCPSAATTASAGGTSSRATPGARSSRATDRTGSASRGRMARRATPQTSPSWRSASRRPATRRRPSSSSTPPSCRTRCGTSTVRAPWASAGTRGSSGCHFTCAADPSMIGRRCSCPTRDGSSRGGAARPGARRTGPRVPIRRRPDAPWRTPWRSTHRIRGPPDAWSVGGSTSVTV